MIRRGRTTRIVLVMLITSTLALGLAAPALAAAPRVSFNQLETEVMCVNCHVPLNIAESAQANDERTLIHQLIAQGLSEQQIKDRLVGQYGDQVLADPPTSGFNITTWLVPVGVIGGIGLLLVLTLPRWRRQGGGAPGAAAPAGPPLPADELRRLDDDLAATEL